MIFQPESYKGFDFFPVEFQLETFPRHRPLQQLVLVFSILDSSIHKHEIEPFEVAIKVNMFE